MDVQILEVFEDQILVIFEFQFIFEVHIEVKILIIFEVQMEVKILIIFEVPIYI